MNKDDILSEIRRTTTENDGKPLGQARFRDATGIGPYEIGKHWAKYSDAIKEAGFLPNDLWTLVPDEILVPQMIRLIRKLNKYPTFGEMRLYQLEEPEFRYQVIKKRQQGPMVRAILDFCKDKSEHKDIVGICAPLQKKSVLATEDTKAISYGFVYLIRGHVGEYKIGHTNLVDRRVSELGATFPVEQKLTHHFKTDDPAGVEAYWHNRFSNKRMKGEWFNLNAADVSAFKRWRKIA